MEYDLIVIGGGPAGYHAARLAGRVGLSVLLAEKRTGSGGEPAVGGVCLHEGCIPTKTLLHSARLLDQARRADRYGLSVPGASLDHGRVMTRKRKIVKTLERGIVTGLKNRMVNIVGGTAALAGRTGDGFLVSIGTERHVGRRLLIASGSVPVIPPLPGVREGLASGVIVTSREILEWEEIPASLAVVGAGAVGLEFAYYFNALGTKVTVVEMLPRVGGTLDAEAAAVLQKQLAGRGIDFRMRSKVTGFERDAVSLEAPSGRETLRADRVLLSIGRRPLMEDLGLASVGLDEERGRIQVDGRGRTAVGGVYAAGDVTGRLLLAHAAYRDAEAAVGALLGKGVRPKHEAVPAVVYTAPEAAWAGESEESARAKGIEYGVAVVSPRLSGRFLVENEAGDGLFKMIFGKKDGRLLGVHMVGDPAAEIIFGASLLIEREATIDDVRDAIFPHPTVSEIFHEAAWHFD